jgi:hypothetical protein
MIGGGSNKPTRVIRPVEALGSRIEYKNIISTPIMYTISMMRKGTPRRYKP